MAQRGKPIDDRTKQQIRRLAELSVRKAAREAGVAPNTIQKYRKKSP